jgi:hypothetical protein
VIRELFQRKASYEANVLAEAQALIDDGLDLEFVLGLFPDDASWLEPMLDVTSDISLAFEGDPASYYFEASLKSRFLGQALEPKPVVPVVVTAPSFSPFRTAVASASVASSAAAIGILALGFVTAGNAAPGDWNYTFKLANERFQYSTSRGDSRIDVQVKQAQARLEELQELGARGEASESQFARAVAAFDDLTQELAKQDDIDDVRKAQIEGIGNMATVVFNDVATKQPDLRPQAVAATEAAASTVAVAVGGATGLPSPTTTATQPPATATAAPETPSPEASETPTPGETVTPTESATPEPEETENPEPSATGTPTPPVSETGTPGTPDPATTP